MESCPSSVTMAGSSPSLKQQIVSYIHIYIYIYIYMYIYIYIYIYIYTVIKRSKSMNNIIFISLLSP